LEKCPNCTFAEMARRRAGLEREQRVDEPRPTGRDTPSGAGKETPSRSILIKASNTSRYAGRVDGQNRWDWTIFIDADQDALSRIQRSATSDSLANRARAANLALCRAVIPDAGPGAAALDVKHRRERYRELTREDLRLCPPCKRGRPIPMQDLPPLTSQRTKAVTRYD
jgi:hypothetical protein